MTKVFAFLMFSYERSHRNLRQYMYKSLFMWLRFPTVTEYNVYIVYFIVYLASYNLDACRRQLFILLFIVFVRSWMRSFINMHLTFNWLRSIRQRVKARFAETRARAINLSPYLTFHLTKNTDRKSRIESQINQRNFNRTTVRENAKIR